MTPQHTNCDISQSRVDLRDTFAAAALTGLLASTGKYSNGEPIDYAATAYQFACAMLRERERTKEKHASFSYTNHDAAPAAKSAEPESSVPLGSGAELAHTQEKP